MSRRRSRWIPGPRPLWAAWLALLAIAAAARAEGPKPTAAGPVLHLVDGGYAEGELRDSEKAGVVRWQARPFVAPFDFDARAVGRIQWPPPEKIERPAGDYCFELAAGDVLFGALGKLDDRRAELIIPRLGTVKIDRADLLRIYRWRDGADLIYLGPNGLVGWHEPAGQSHWREESGQPTTDREGSSIRGDFGLPARAVVEFEVSWKTKPDFVLALGVDDRDASVKRAFRFEAWGGDLVVQRELEQEADLSVVQEVKNGPGRAHLQAYLDQEKGRILVFSPGGTQLADLQVGAGKAPAMSGLYLANIRGDVRLEWLRIGRWNGEVPREVRVDQARLHRADGSITYGTLAGYRPEAKAFVLKTEKGEQAIAAADVSSVFLSPTRPGPARTVRAVYLDGTRLSGELERVDAGALMMKIPGVEGATRLPIAGLRSLVGVAPGAKEPTGDPLPRLEADGVRLIGRHEDGVETPAASCLVWHPAGSSTASPMKRGASGRIFYREPPAPRPSVGMTTEPVGRIVVQQLNAARPAAPRPAAPRPPADEPAGKEPRSLYLRSGDVVAAIVTRIDEKGVHFRSSMSTTTFVPHEKVKAVELAPLSSLTVRLGTTKADRLLTLPRMQKANPPTHLIRSRHGDYLRVRLIGMDEKVVRVEARLEEKDLPRDRVSEIIWLHPEELKPVARPATDDAPTRVQAVRRDGIRVTFTPTRFADGTLYGTSDVLGDTRIRIAEIDQLPIGEAIREAASHLKYGRWTLHNAPEPIEPVNDAPGGGGGSGSTGTESALVGKPAPDFDLALLDGKRYRLSGSKGKIVVLDFWATWCGPCIRAMPEVEKVAAEFDEKDVQLVAVNLQESPEQIRAMMDRHNLKAPRVALDRDGAIAEKYQAHAIPQTVVIGRDGKVARLFVGGGPHLADQLRDAIKAAAK